MAEEVQDAAYTLPRTMVLATVVNGGLMFVTCITICYCIGDLDSGKFSSVDARSLADSLNAVLSTPTGYPFIQIFYNSTQSLAGTNTMTAIVIILSLFSNVTITAGSSRQLFAFARDKGIQVLSNNLGRRD